MAFYGIDWEARLSVLSSSQCKLEIHFVQLSGGDRWCSSYSTVCLMHIMVGGKYVLLGLIRTAATPINTAAGTLSCAHEGASHGEVAWELPDSLDPYRHADHRSWPLGCPCWTISLTCPPISPAENAAKRGHMCITLQGTWHALLSAYYGITTALIFAHVLELRRGAV